jgi:teichuronic acid biosynthesis glycosyltransferase TuaC
MRRGGWLCGASEQLAMGDRLRVLLAVSGFPTPEKPNRQFFNQSSAEALAARADLDVVFLRLWRPGWPVLTTRDSAFGKLHTLAAPGLPGGFPLRWRRLWDPVCLLSFREFGWRALAPIVERCHVIHSVDAFIPGVPAGYWSERAQKPHVTQATGSDVYSLLPSEASLPLVRNWHGRVHAAVCNSQELADRVTRIAPGIPIVRTVYRGTDLKRFRPRDETVARIRSRDADIRFLFLGGLPAYPYHRWGEDTKGGVTLMEAWSVAEQRLATLGATLMFAGPGSDADRAHLWKATLKFPANVSVHGVVVPDALPAEYGSADVVIVPSREEGLPNVAVEAMASGRPVLGARTGGIPEVVKHAETGILIDAGSVDQLATAMVELAEHRETVERMGRAARIHAEERFDRSRYADAMMPIYREVISMAGKNRGAQ